MGDRSQAARLAAVLKPGDVALLNEDFQMQAMAYNLHYDCRECVHLVEANSKCSMEYPNGMLLDAAAHQHALEDNGDLVFCKYFELS